jgi:hypothetical protein
MPEGGFPIRKSPDQSSFATPRSLSQRTTSFIASQCQGIHRMPLRRLIALIINALHPPPPKEQPVDHTTDKTILLRIHPMPARCTPRDPAPRPKGRQDPGSQPDECPLHNVKQPADAPGHRPAHAANPHRTATPEPEWWSQTGSNRRPHACKARALPAELWPRRRRAAKWWAWEDLNFRPHAYQARALTN